MLRSSQDPNIMVDKKLRITALFSGDLDEFLGAKVIPGRSVLEVLRHCCHLSPQEFSHGEKMLKKYFDSEFINTVAQGKGISPPFPSAVRLSLHEVEKWIHIRIVPLISHKGQIQSLGIVFCDVSEDIKNKRDLEKAHDKLENLHQVLRVDRDSIIEVFNDLANLDKTVSQASFGGLSLQGFQIELKRIEGKSEALGIKKVVQRISKVNQLLGSSS